MRRMLSGWNPSCMGVRPATEGTETDTNRTMGRAKILRPLRAAALPGAVVAAVAVGLAMAAATKPSVSLRGSPASMEHQYEVARSEDFTFAESPAAVADLVAKERLVRIEGGADYTLHQVSYPFARPEVRTLVEELSAKYRFACGEPLVVTSLTRPRSAQPGNAHELSVHPAGMAVDFRISKSPKCVEWFEKTLLAMERKELLDATRERNPPHFHVAVFPGVYAAYAATRKSSSPPPASPTAMQPEHWPRQQPAEAAAPAGTRRPTHEPLHAPQRAGIVLAAGIIGVLALLVVWLIRRLRRMT